MCALEAHYNAVIAQHRTEHDYQLLPGPTTTPKQLGARPHMQRVPNRRFLGQLSASVKHMMRAACSCHARATALFVDPLMGA